MNGMVSTSRRAGAATKAILTAVCIVGLVVAVVIDEAEASNGNRIKAATTGATGAKSPSVARNRAPTSGTYKADPGDGVRDHRGGSPSGGVQVTDGKKRPPRPPPPLCAGWFCDRSPRPTIRDHRKHTATPPGPPSPGRTQPK